MAKSRRTLKGRQGHYELLVTLAAGALSQTHLAVMRTADSSTRFALVRESLPRVSADPALAQAFLAEIRALARFDHPNLVRTLETASNKTSYLAISEYLEGEGLGLLVQTAAEAGQPLEAALAVELVAQTCDGLDHAHRLTDDQGAPLNLVHGAITPPRMVIGYDGRVRLIGFDLWNSASRRPEPSATQAMAYLSPEQCHEEPADARTDVFCLGIILWELLAQRPLFLRVSQQGTRQAIVATAVPPMGAANRGVTPGLEAIARQALQADPGARFQSADEFGAALRGWQAETGQAIGPAGLAARMGELLAERLGHKRTLLRKAQAGQVGASKAQLLAPDQEHAAAWATTSQRITLEARSDPPSQPAPTGSLPARPEPPTPAPSSQPPAPTSSASRPAASEASTAPTRAPSRTGLWIVVGALSLLATAAGLGWALGWWASGPGPQAEGPDAGPVTPSPSQPALLTVQSDPEGCAIWLDEQPLASPTPLREQQLEPGGAHRVAVRCAGHLEQVLQLTAQPAERVTLAFHPDPEPPKGLLRLTTVPVVEVYLGAELLGSTPLEGKALPAGEQELKLVHKASGTTRLVKVRIQPDQTTRLFQRIAISKKPR